MPTNKVVLNDEVLIDLSEDTVVEEQVLPGYTFHKADGTKAEGTYTPKVIPLNATESGGYSPPDGVVGFNPVNVLIAAGAESASRIAEKDVNFYDYDGTLLYSFSLAQAQALTELPTLPEHEGLIAQEWNYTLEEIKSYDRRVDIGATYITDDGKTRLYITIPVDGRKTIPLYFNQTTANGITIDWGDGSATETLSGTGNVNTSHTYASGGDYIIALAVNSGILELGQQNNTYNVFGRFGAHKTTYSEIHAQTNMLKKVELGSGVKKIGTTSFKMFRALKTVTIPNSVTSIGSYSFENCISMECVVLPKGFSRFDGGRPFGDCLALRKFVLPNNMASVGNSTVGAFNDCYLLDNIVLPNGLSNIYGNSFANCISLFSIMIPASVTNIGNYAFTGCIGLKICDFASHTSVPTLDSNAFGSVGSNTPSDLEIRVPAVLYDEWIAATNWATYAGYIVAV